MEALTEHVQNEKGFWNSLEVRGQHHWILKEFEGVGDFTFKGTLRFGGRWKGSVVSKKGDDGLLVVLAEARIEGRVSVSELVVEGEIFADSITADFIRLKPGSRIRAQAIKAQRIVVELGAIVEGQLKIGQGQERT